MFQNYVILCPENLYMLKILRVMRISTGLHCVVILDHSDAGYYR